jgi:hypothetical protein
LDGSSNNSGSGGIQHCVGPYSRLWSIPSPQFLIVCEVQYPPQELSRWSSITLVLRTHATAKKAVPITDLLVHSVSCQHFQPRPGSSRLPLWSSLSRVLPSSIAVLQPWLYLFRVSTYFISKNNTCFNGALFNRVHNNSNRYLPGLFLELALEIAIATLGHKGRW